MSQQPQIQEAGAPFDDSDADMIVRSSDGVDFRAHRWPLTKASRAFSDMFAALSLRPKDASSTDGQQFKDGLPIIPLTETSRTLRLFFQLLFPIDNPDISDPCDMAALMETLNKYVVEGFSNTIRSMLLKVAENAPQSVYVIACRFQLPDIAKVAAKESLHIPGYLSLSDEEAKYLTGPQYNQLMRFRNDCEKIATKTSYWSRADTLSMLTPGPEYMESVDPAELCQCTCSFDLSGGDAPDWFYVHFAEFWPVLKRSPHPSTLLHDPPFLRPDLSAKAFECPSCKRYLECGELNRLRVSFMKILEQRYDQVDLNIS